MAVTNMYRYGELFRAKNIEGSKLITLNEEFLQVCIKIASFLCGQTVCDSLPRLMCLLVLDKSTVYQTNFWKYTI